MRIECDCEKRCEFDANHAQKKLIESAIVKGQKFLMIQCGICDRTIPINPNNLSLPKSVKDRKYRCVTEGCDGIVVHVVDETENFWGCGQCGTVWDNESELISLGAKLID